MKQNLEVLLFSALCCFRTACLFLSTQENRQSYGSFYKISTNFDQTKSYVSLLKVSLIKMMKEQT